MNIKKKLMMGAAAATMGLSMIGGGTWAAFNDIEDVTAAVENGELKLNLAEYQGPIEFKVSDLKPGDSMKRYITLEHEEGSSIAIKDVLLSIDNITFDDFGYDENGNRDLTEAGADYDIDIFGKNSAIDYLEQFDVNLVRTGIEGADEAIISDADNITLADIYKATNPSILDATAITKLSNAVGNHWVDGRINLASAATNSYTGLPIDPEDWDTLEMVIEFNKYSTRDARGVEEQNKYQGDTTDVKFTLEARQWDGQEITDADLDANGYVETNQEVNNGN